MAAAIRASYIQARSAFDTLRAGVVVTFVPTKKDDKGFRGDLDRPEEKVEDTVWVKLAYQFITQRLDPVDYIFWVFDHYARENTMILKRPLEPNQILGEHIVSQYFADRGSAMRRIELALEQQRSLAFCRVANAQTLRHQNFNDSHAGVLLDVTLQLSALFRYCLACQLRNCGRPDVNKTLFSGIAKQFVLQAVMQFQRNRKAYTEAWKEVLPPDFVAQATLLYTQAIGAYEEKEPDDAECETEQN